MNNFTPWLSLGGGLLIGISAAILFFFNGKIAGISGIFGNIISPGQNHKRHVWNLLFIGGLILGGISSYIFAPESFAVEISRPTWLLVIAGLFVGFGTSLANGCTSGHGVCGISRFSFRSIIATGVFILAGIVTVIIFKQLAGNI